MLYKFWVSVCITDITNGNVDAQNMVGYLKQYLSSGKYKNILTCHLQHVLRSLLSFLDPVEKQCPLYHLMPKSLTLTDKYIYLGIHSLSCTPAVHLLLHFR
jgi:hypothetical protein